jgi:hypothetical protein
MPPTTRFGFQTVKPLLPLRTELIALIEGLNQIFPDKLSFEMRFQALKLVLNGKLPPASVFSLLPTLSKLVSQGIPTRSCAEALRHLYKTLPSFGPDNLAENFTRDEMSRKIISFTSEHVDGYSPYQTAKKYDHLALIHRIRVTPTGIYLEGPELEVSLALEPYCAKTQINTIVGDEPRHSKA